MATRLKTWARLRAPVLCITGTGLGVGIPLAKGGRISVSGVIIDTSNVVYEGPVFLGAQQTMLRTDFNPFVNLGSSGSPAQVRTPYFTADSPSYTSNPGTFGEWLSLILTASNQTLTEDQKAQLIGQTVATTTTSFAMTTAAFSGGQFYTPGFEDIVTIGNLTEV